MKLRALAVTVAVLAGLLVWEAAPAHAQSAYPTFYPDLSAGLTPSMGLSNNKRAWHPNADTASLRTSLSLYLNPGIALMRGIRFELGLGFHSIEPPLTFAIMPSVKFFPFHKYAFKAPMTRRRGGKWVAPNPITGIYFRPVFMITLGSLGLKDKDDVDGDATDQTGTACTALAMELVATCIEADARNDKARAPLIFGGGLGVGFHLRGEGKPPKAPEAPGMGEGLTDWRGGLGSEAAGLDAPPAPEAPEMPEAPEPPKPPAIGFDIEILAMFLKHGTRPDSVTAYLSNLDYAPIGVGGTRPFTSAESTLCIAGPPVSEGGTGNAWLADCEHNVVEFRVELRLSLILFFGP